MTGLVVIDEIKDNGRFLCVECSVYNDDDKLTDSFILELDTEYMGIDTNEEFEDALLNDIQYAYDECKHKSELTDSVEENWYGTGKYKNMKMPKSK